MSLLLVVLLAVAQPHGVTRPMTVTRVCATRWGLDARHVTVSMKRAARQRAHVTDMTGKVYDHWIPRQLAGADRANNLIVQARAAAHRKDVVENALHRQVCAGQLTLKAAQAQIRAWHE